MNCTHNFYISKKRREYWEKFKTPEQYLEYIEKYLNTSTVNDTLKMRAKNNPRALSTGMENILKSEQVVASYADLLNYEPLTVVSELWGEWQEYSPCSAKLLVVAVIAIHRYNLKQYFYDPYAPRPYGIK